MIIAPQLIRDALGYRQSWISARFSHVAKDCLVYAHSQYDVDDMIAVAIAYESNSRNPKQKEKSEQMMKATLKFLQGLKNGRNVHIQ